MTSIAIDRLDGLSSATAIKGPVRCATTANISLSGLQSIDGVSVAAGDRVLVRAQTTASDNGIYVVATGAWRRAKDFSRNTDVRKGTQILVTEGTLYASSGWYVSTSDPITIGSSSIALTQNILLNGANLVALEAAAAASAAAAANSVAGLSYVFSTTTTDADPGAGIFRLNHATIASATAAFIDNADADGVTVTGILDSWDDATATVRGTLTIRSKATAAIHRTFNVTGSVVDGTGYRKLTIAYVGGAGTLTNTMPCWLVFQRAGSDGAQGLQGIQGIQGIAGTAGTNGADGTDGADGADPGVLLTWDTGTTDANPGPGLIRANSASLASATVLYVSKTNRAGSSIATFLLGLADSTNTVKGHLVITDPASDAQTIFNVTGVTDATGYVKVAVASPSGAASFADDLPVSFQFSRAGNVGAAGAGSGDMQAATYDPTSKTADAFAMANMVEGTTNKIFTATERTKLSGIEAAADVTDAGNVGSSIHGATGKTTPVDADTVALIDSAASNVLKKATWANVKATLKTYFDTLYAAASHTHTVSQLSDASANGRSLIAMTYANMRTALGLAIGTDVQAYDAQLSSLVRQNSQSAAYTLVLTDGGKHIYHPASDTTARIWTIPANSSVAFPIGTVITFDNDIGAGAITIAITTDTLVLVGAGTTGSRTLAAGGQATAIKVTSTRWRISGVGLT